MNGLYVGCLLLMLVVIQRRLSGYRCLFCGTRDGSHGQTCPWQRR